MNIRVITTDVCTGVGTLARNNRVTNKAKCRVFQACPVRSSESENETSVTFMCSQFGGRVVQVKYVIRDNFILWFLRKLKQAGYTDV